MKDASTYPITTDFGYIPGYPLNNGYHRGQDRAMPNSTPVIVNGVTLGLSNNTGASTGPHLHIGKFVNGTAVNPLGQGFTFAAASVLDTGYDSSNGNYVRLNADGAVWVYLHLQSIMVIKGQQLEGSNVQDQINDLNDQLNQTNIYVGELQTSNTELNKQLNTTNGYIDKLTKRVAALEAGASPQPTDGIYELKKVK